MHRLSDEVLEVKAQSIIKNMNGNPNYPLPMPELDAMTQALTAFQTALVAQRTGTPSDTARKNDLRTALMETCRRLANAVEAKCNGDLSILLSSGFDARKEPTPAGRLQKPDNFQVTVTGLPGSVKVSVGKVEGATLYMFQYALGPVTDTTQWQTINSTTRNKIIDKLEPGKLYAFRVGAGGGDPEVVYSDVVTRYVS